MLRQLLAARRLGGLAAALPRAVEPMDVLLVAGGPAALAAAVRRAPRREGCGRGAATRALGAARGFCASAGSGGEPAEAPAAVAAPPERESATARGDAGGDAAEAGPAAGTVSAPARMKRARHTGVHGEKTASGRPKPDVRTVARLVELGWMGTAEEVEALLTKRRINNRYPYETAGPAIDWLIETLGEEEHSSGRCCAAHAVYKFPLILTRSMSMLERGWEMVVHSRETGGLGLSEAVARKRVAGLPQVLCFSKDFVKKRASFLETLGVRDGCATTARHFAFLGWSEERLRSGAEWLRSQGLDAERVMSAHPSLLWRSPKSLSPKLSFLRGVVGLSNSEISPLFLAYTLENRMRPRYFYTMQRGVVQRYTFSSLVIPSDANFLKRANGLASGVRATAAEIAAYQAHIATPAFRAYMDEQEQAMRARGPRAPVSSG